MGKDPWKLLKEAANCPPDEMEEAGLNWSKLSKQRNMATWGTQDRGGPGARGPMGPTPAGLKTPDDIARDQDKKMAAAQAHRADPSVKAFFQGGDTSRPTGATDNPLLKPTGLTPGRIGGMLGGRMKPNDDGMEEEGMELDLPMAGGPDLSDLDELVPDEGPEDDGDTIEIPRSLAQELVDFLASQGLDEPEEDDGDSADMELPDEDDDDEEADDEVAGPPPPPKKGPGRPPGAKNKEKSKDDSPKKKGPPPKDDDGDDEPDEKDEAMEPVQPDPSAKKRPPSYLPGVHNPDSPMRPGKRKGPPSIAGVLKPR